MLHVHRADRADALVRALGRLLADAPPDPLASELVAVPTRGIERWLTQTLSNTLGAQPGRGDGIVANVQFPSPRQLIDDAVAAACGSDPDPWRPERVIWTLTQLVDAHLDEEWLRVLHDHLRDSAADPDDPPRRLSAVRHLAVLFDRYALHRPDLLRRWLAGEDVGSTGEPLDPARAWQAELWRRLRASIGEPSPAERVRTAAARLQGDEQLLDLPPRLSVFGLTRLPVAHLDVLAAIARHRDVHLLALHPSAELWRRGDDQPRNRLLTSWGRDVRDLQTVLATHAPEDHAEHDTREAPRTLLQRIQQDIRDDVEPKEQPTLDRSIEIHACHGRARQVEVLRDAILHALADDPSLEPRDVVVMCPDIEAFAPLVHATFGSAGEHDRGLPDLRVRLADRALKQTNPLLGVIARLLETVDGRMTAADVLDLADRPPVRRRFVLDEDAVGDLERWAADTNVRWGLDAGMRAPFGLATVEANTWRAGVDRVLAGATMTDESLTLVADSVLPYDDVDSTAIDLAGRLAELVARLTAVRERLAGRHTITGWAETLGHAADLLTATSERDAWQRLQLDALLAQLVEEAGGTTSELGLAEVRALLGDQLQGRPTRANFRTGHLTFCTLNPMRSVPHRVVCLLGLDDESFPRKAPRDGDDLIFEHRLPGDHDARSEDRQLLLDALMAAEDRLIVTYTGNDERTNARRPPAVPVGELMDMIERTGGTAARGHVCTHHPLQPFDPENFLAEEPFGFDCTNLEGARALQAPSTPRAPLVARAVDVPRERTVDLEDLVRWVEHPVRAFLTETVGMRLTRLEDEPSDRLPLAVKGLEHWAVGQRLLDAIMAGHSEQHALAAEAVRGSLPPGELRRAVANEIGRDVRRIVAHAREHLPPSQGATSVDVRVPLPDGRVLTGTVAGVDGGCLRTVSFSRVAPKHRLAAYVRLLALTAARPGTAWEAWLIGRARKEARNFNVTAAYFAPVEEAVAQLAALVDLHDRGRREPAPVACRASEAYAQASRRRQNPDHAAAGTWDRSWEPGEGQEDEYVLVHGGEVTYRTLSAERPRDDERWDPEHTSRFGQWAVRLWSGALDAETRRDLR